MDGKLRKMASGHSTYDLANADQKDLFAIADLLEAVFHFQMVAAPVAGLDGVYWDSKKDKIRLTLGWDIWSGIFIMSNCADGDVLVAAIGSYLEQMQ